MIDDLQSPHHPIGAKGVSAPAAIANAVPDALARLGVTTPDIPITARNIWEVLNHHDAALEE